MLEGQETSVLAVLSVGLDLAGGSGGLGNAISCTKACVAGTKSMR